MISNKSPRGWHAFYHTPQWYRKRREILARDHGECQKCREKSPAVFTRANTVHHIKHLKDEPELALTDDNLVSLCSDCHDAEHPEKHPQPETGFLNEERW